MTEVDIKLHGVRFFQLYENKHEISAELMWTIREKKNEGEQILLKEKDSTGQSNILTLFKQNMQYYNINVVQHKVIPSLFEDTAHIDFTEDF